MQAVGRHYVLTVALQLDAETVAGLDESGDCIGPDGRRASVVAMEATRAAGHHRGRQKVGSAPQFGVSVVRLHDHYSGYGARDNTHVPRHPISEPLDEIGVGATSALK